MPRHSGIDFFVSLLACGFVFAGTPALAATASFTVSANNTTMPATGLGAVPITLTSVNSYTGTITATCAPANPPVGSKLPICGSPTAPKEYTLTANNATTGTIPLEAAPYPVAGRLQGPGFGRTGGIGGAAGIALGAGLLFGLTRRRRARRWLALSLLAFGTLVGMAGISACGGNNQNTLTPGTYAYVVTATDINTSATATTTVNITVPAGIPYGI